MFWRSQTEKDNYNNKYFNKKCDFLTGIRKSLPARQGSAEEAAPQEATVIPNQESLIGDLLSMDLGSTGPTVPAPVAAPTSNVDLLGGGLDVLVCSFYLS